MIRKKATKPPRPFDGFPLTAHLNGQWCKNIRGRLHYFGPWTDWQGALDLFQVQKDDLYAGRTPHPLRQDSQDAVWQIAWRKRIFDSFFGIRAISGTALPNIAKVLDAASTDSGRPYFVMADETATSGSD